MGFLKFKFSKSRHIWDVQKYTKATDIYLVLWILMDLNDKILYLYEEINTVHIFDKVRELLMN